jgi:hypothetical protein
MIRILRVLEYVYDTAEVAAADMGRWTQQSPPNWLNGRMRMRSAALPFEALRFDGDIEVPDFGRVDTPVVPGPPAFIEPVKGKRYLPCCDRPTPRVVDGVITACAACHTRLDPPSDTLAPYPKPEPEQGEPLLGLATTRELLGEIVARMSVPPVYPAMAHLVSSCIQAKNLLDSATLNYRTVDH